MLCGPAGTSVSTNVPSRSVTAWSEVPSTETSAPSRYFPVEASTTVPLTVPPCWAWSGADESASRKAQRPAPSHRPRRCETLTIFGVVMTGNGSDEVWYPAAFHSRRHATKDRSMFFADAPHTGRCGAEQPRVGKQRVWEEISVSLGSVKPKRTRVRQFECMTVRQ